MSSARVVESLDKSVEDLLPPDLARDLAPMLARQLAPLDDHFALFDELPEFRDMGRFLLAYKRP